MTEFHNADTAELSVVDDLLAKPAPIRPACSCCFPNIRQEAGPKINEVGARLDTFSDAAVAVSSLLESFQEFTLAETGRVKPEQLARLAGQAMQLSAALQKLQGFIGDGEGPAAEKDVIAAANKVELVLENCQAVVDDMNADLGAARPVLSRLEAKILGWMLLGAVAVTVVASWVAVSQVSLFAHGLKWCRDV
jgi:hypothetical protein